MDAEFRFPQDQLFECRDCPSRCCRNWGITVTPEEARRYGENDWARARLADCGASFRSDKAGRVLLPMREVDRRLECVFLDDDGLCGLHKRFGHSFIPVTCQVFPFRFVRDETGRVAAHLSHFCPSIRDNYGAPIGPKLADKLAQAGGRIAEMPDATPLGRGPVLSRVQTGAIANHWAASLEKDKPVTQILADLYDELDRLRAALRRPGAAAGPVADSDFDAAWRRATAASPTERLPAGQPPPPVATVLLAVTLFPLVYPVRVLAVHAVRKPGERPPSALDSLSAKARLIFQQGEMDFLFIEKPVPLEKLPRVARFLTRPAGAHVRAFLRSVVDRRDLFRPETDLYESLFTLGLAATLISRFARCRAAAEARPEVDIRDIREGIGAAEFSLLSHARLLAGWAFTRLILRGFATNRLSFRNVLAAENG